MLLVVIASVFSFLFFRNAQQILITGDLPFHFSRIKGLSSVFSGPINFTTFNSYGGGVNFFYPYLTLFPAVIFYWMTNNLILSYVLYVWILNVCTILVTYYYGQKFFKRVDAGILIQLSVYLLWLSSNLYLSTFSHCRINCSNDYASCPILHVCSYF